MFAEYIQLTSGGGGETICLETFPGLGRDYVGLNESLFVFCLWLLLG